MFLINRVSKSYNRVLIFIAFSLINSVSLADFSSIDIKSYKSPTVKDEGISVFSEAQCCEAPKVKLPTKSADVKQEILFSRQDGSWMFQSLVNNGLFEIASQYQPQHPRALVIKNGKITLEQLYLIVNDDQVISKNKLGYSLFYPLIIEPTAALIIERQLELVSKSGVAIINRGQLYINESLVVATNSDSSDFRSFILSWNNSYTSIIKSKLKNLGYDGYLSQGLTLTSHEKSLSAKRGILVVDESTIEGAYIGIASDLGKVYLSNNKLISSHSSGLDLRRSDVFLVRNSVVGTKFSHGIRLIDNKIQRIIKNSASSSSKSGIVVFGSPKESYFLGNKFEDNTEHGIWISTDFSSAETTLVVKGNVIANNVGSGIKTNCLGFCVFESNLIIGNNQYGFSLENINNNLHKLVLKKNYFKLNGLASIQASGLKDLVLAKNKFHFDAINTKVFVGDLERHQSLIQKSLFEKNQSIQITKEMVQ